MNCFKQKILRQLLICTNSAGNNNDTSSTYMDSDTIRNSLCNASSVLTIFFVAEVIMKMIAFTPYGYWQSRRNRADLVVTILGVGWIVVDYIFNNHYTLSFGTFYNTVQGNHTFIYLINEGSRAYFFSPDFATLHAQIPTFTFINILQTFLLLVEFIY